MKKEVPFFPLKEENSDDPTNGKKKMYCKLRIKY